MQVTQVMRPNVVALGPQATVQEAAQLMQQRGVGLLVVVADGETTGVVTDRDIALRVVAAGAPPERTLVGDIMTRSVVSVAEYQDVEDVTQQMQHHKVRRVVVLDRDNYPIGIVSLTDLAAPHPARH